MPIAGQGWELLISRRSQHQRGPRVRTIGSYQVFHDGVPQATLSGTTVETKGPGDNRVAGNGLRIEPGRYPLATQNGTQYVTVGYVVTDDADQTPKPGLLVMETEPRFDILIHPGHDFLASTGCINLTEPLADGDADIAFVDSRDRVIAAINDLKAFAGEAFPQLNGHAIANAWIVIDGEP